MAAAGAPRGRWARRSSRSGDGDLLAAAAAGRVRERRALALGLGPRRPRGAAAADAEDDGEACAGGGGEGAAELGGAARPGDGKARRTRCLACRLRSCCRLVNSARSRRLLI